MTHILHLISYILKGAPRAGAGPGYPQLCYRSIPPGRLRRCCYPLRGGGLQSDLAVHYQGVLVRSACKQRALKSPVPPVCYQV